MPLATQLTGTTNEGKILGFHPKSYDLALDEHHKNDILQCCRPHLPLVFLKVIKHQADSVAPKAPSAITGLPISATMTFSTAIYAMEIEIPTCPMVSTNNRASRRALLEPRRLIWMRTTGIYPIQISLGKISGSSSGTRRWLD